MIKWLFYERFSVIELIFWVTLSYVAPKFNFWLMLTLGFVFGAVLGIIQVNIR